MTHDDDATRDWLGLPADADDAEVTRTRAELAAFLDTAPAGLQEWARRQADGSHIHPAPAPRPTQVTTPTPRRRRSPLVPLGIAAAVAAGVVGVYHLGDGPTPTTPGQAASPTPGSSTDPQAMAAAHGAAGVPVGESATPPPLDEALVSRLQARIKADPKDVDSLRRLANEYSRAGHYRKATDTQARIVALQPDNIDALVALGVAQFNSDDLASAEKTWTLVLDKDPKNAEAYYDLGFLYFATNPPQVDKAEQMWTKLTEVAPDSEEAKNVKNHLAEFKKGATGGTSPTDVPAAPKTNG